MHQRIEIGERARDGAGDLVIRDVQHGESTQAADVGGDRAGELVPDQVEDPEEGEGRDAGGNGAGDGLPVGDGEAGEAGEFADGRRDEAGHVAGAVGLLEDGILGLAAEIDVGDSVRLRVATDTVPAAAALVALPGVEDAEVGLVEGSLEG